MEDEWKKRIHKPVGIYYLTIIVFLNFGVYQFLNDFIDLRENDNETPLLIATILISLDVLSAGSAIWALIGENTGRISLLIFVTLNALWSVFVLIIAVSYRNLDSNILLFGFSLIKPLFLLGICWWYFTDKNVIAYYKQD